MNTQVQTARRIKETRAERRQRGFIPARICCLLLACLLFAGSLILGLPGSVQADTLTITAALPTGQVNAYYSTTLTASGGTPPYTWSLAGGSLPAWLNLSSTGVISGTTSTQGTFTFVVGVTDSAANSTQRTLSLTIAAPPLNFGMATLPSAKENTSYSAAMNVSGGTPPYTFWVVSGALPAGLYLDETTGTISGIPARGSAGTVSFAIRITDSSYTPISTQRSFIIAVEKGSYQAVITVGNGLKDGRTALLINGIQVASLQGGQSIQRDFDLGTSQTISVEPLIEDTSGSGVRYKVENASTTVSESYPSAIFNYYTEYYVEVKTQPANLGQIGGSGWYREGSTLLAAAPSILQPAAEADTQYRFAHWVSPGGAQAAVSNLNQTVTMPGAYTARYDTYYLLSFNSARGEQKESAWYKAGSRADWQLSAAQVPMSGILGFFRGTYNAVNDRGSIVMDRPQTVTVKWEPDCTMPLILIPGALLLAVLVIYGLYSMLRGPDGKAAAAYPATRAMPPTQFVPQYPPAPPATYLIPPPVYPLPPPVYTVSPPVYPAVALPARPALPQAGRPVPRPERVTIGITNTEKQDGNREARQKIVEEFARLLDEYASEIAASKQNPGPPELNTPTEVRRPALPEQHKLN